MAWEFDPAWEYYEPDPEVAWVVYSNGRARDPLDCIRQRDKLRTNNLGFRLGRGNPNRCTFRYGREKRGRQEAEPLPDRECPKCKRVFTPKKRHQVWCSKKCGCGAPKAIPTTRECAECGAVFEPYWSEHRYCSRRCGALVGARMNPHVIPEGFAAMYRSGASLAEMEALFGVARCTLKRWRSRLGLAKRPSGNHSRRAP